jgi:hypothetical protein
MSIDYDEPPPRAGRSVESRTIDHRTLRPSGKMKTWKQDDLVQAPAYLGTSLTDEEDAREEEIARMVEEILITADPSLTKETARCRQLFQEITGVDPASASAPWHEGKERPEGRPLFDPQESVCADALIESVDRLANSRPRPHTISSTSRKLRVVLSELLKAKKLLAGEQATENEHDQVVHAPEVPAPQPYTGKTDARKHRSAAIDMPQHNPLLEPGAPRSTRPRRVVSRST